MPRVSLGLWSLPSIHQFAPAESDRPDCILLPGKVAFPTMFPTDFPHDPGKHECTNGLLSRSAPWTAEAPQRNRFCGLGQGSFRWLGPAGGGGASG